MTTGQFIALNWRILEARLKRLTSPDTPDPLSMWDQLDRSVPGRVIGAVDRVLTRAAPESRASDAWRSAALPWASLDPLHRMRAIGGVAVSAAISHVALAFTMAPVGAWWLILPGIVLVFGAAAITLSFLGPAAKGHD